MVRNTKEKIRKCLENKGIDADPIDFIKIVSNVYHKYDSSLYDQRQISITCSTKYWQMAFRRVKLSSDKKLKVLDFGCGTGSATLQLLSSSISKKYIKNYML